MSILKPDLAHAIRNVLENTIKEHIEIEADKAAEIVRDKIRASTANIIMRVLSDYSVERDGLNILIRVKLPE